MYCGQSTLVKYAPDRREATTLRCRAWTCPDCVDRRKAQLIAQAHRGNANTFITLTCKREHLPTPEAAALALSNAWRIIVKRALRENRRDPEKNPYPFGACDAEVFDLNGQRSIPRQVRLPNGRLDYLVVIEAHESGWPHLHILCRSQWIGRDWLAEQMRDLLESPVVDIRRITKRSQVNAYVAKYCGKCAHKFGSAKRYWQTPRYQLTKYEKKNAATYPWQDVSRSDHRLYVFIKHWEQSGWIVFKESIWHVIAEPPSTGWGEPARGAGVPSRGSREGAAH